ncbi:MAG: SCO family protein [Fimbriimonadaceae bacterium]|nr:SCO family protein [Chitinophagales bacterium]
MKRSKHLIIIGSILTAFILFVIFVYLPYADKQSQTTKMATSLWPSENLRDPVQEIPAFNFIDQNNKTITNEYVKGKVYVADFFYTTCEAACPMMSTQLTKVQKDFIKNNDFRILSFALDPNDSLSVIKTFADKYEANDNTWHFLRGDSKKIYKLGEEGFLQIVKDGDNNFEGHTQKLTLVDKKGMIRGFYLGIDSAEVANLINDINYLLNKEQI